MMRELTGAHDHRPDFMVTLGLAPPYVLEDVKAAYREKAKLAHPDRGGSAAAFNEVQQAFERAQEFMEFRADRRAWMAAKMARYMALEQAVVRLQRLGAKVITAAPRWLEQSFGDFSQLAETATLVRAPDAANGDEIIAALVAEQVPLRELLAIELPGARVTDAAVLSLGIFQQLTRLDLSRTPVTSRVLAIVDKLPALESLAIDGSRIGWWPRWRVGLRLRGRRAG